ncbi:putative ribonuclease H-like domain-containing protein [Senna tora]|uniref:Putative ribonuclease H-like domain-containing protein n=1 Tax=Senna tora TaxID=362788 RepID=A0A834TJF7_9FABA|nr:putative ribonuclease H-like domain-containing protein [Senna tora]
MVVVKTILAPDDVAVAVVEAIGVKWGLQLAKQCSIYKLEAETDCAVVTNYFNNVSTFDLSIVNDIMSDCQQLGASFDSFSFKHIYKECNQHLIGLGRQQLQHNIIHQRPTKCFVVGALAFSSTILERNKIKGSLKNLHRHCASPAMISFKGSQQVAGGGSVAGFLK